MDDKHATLMQHLSLISNVFETVVQYMQSLQVSYLAAKRVFDMSHALLVCHSSSSVNYTDNDFISYHEQIESEKKKKMSNLQELMECCSKSIIFPKDMGALLDDYRDRRKDFVLASANFKNLLENSKLSVSQMKKLQWQHDTILKDFQQSRLLLDKELPKIINLRLEALQQFFHKIAELFGDMNYNMQAANLLELISMNLRQIDSEKIMFHEQETSKEICQKCKVNHVDKK
ncbi:uncharacterized protein [Anoplolepis gracilipes]|uniref:uncharacterized protein n=1 Tax=Anoplolepis gracilipes TaxID=354296 RepID=UPI003B9F25B8